MSSSKIRSLEDYGNNNDQAPSRARVSRQASSEVSGLLAGVLEETSYLAHQEENLRQAELRAREAERQRHADEEEAQRRLAAEVARKEEEKRRAKAEAKRRVLLGEPEPQELVPAAEPESSEQEQELQAAESARKQAEARAREAEAQLKALQRSPEVVPAPAPPTKRAPIALGALFGGLAAAAAAVFVLWPAPLVSDASFARLSIDGAPVGVADMVEMGFETVPHQAPIVDKAKPTRKRAKRRGTKPKGKFTFPVDLGKDDVWGSGD